MLQDTSNRNSSSPSIRNSSSFHASDVHNQARSNIDRILSAAMEEQKYRRANGFFTYNQKSLLDGEYQSHDEDEIDGFNNTDYKEDEYIHQLQNQRNQRLDEEHKRFEMNARERRQRIAEKEKGKKDLALAIIQRRKMKQASLKLMDVSNINVQFKQPTVSYDSSVRTSSFLTLSPASSSSSCSFEYGENEENQFNDEELMNLEIESSSNISEEDEEECKEWDELDIDQCFAFDECDHITLSIEDEDFPSPSDKEDDGHLHKSQSYDVERFHNNRFMTISNQSY